MCELLGMECNVPTDIVFSFTALSMRGGRTAAHSDGWGLALYHGLFARLLLEPAPAGGCLPFSHGLFARLLLEPAPPCDSSLARYVRDNPIPTLLAVAHVRKRTVGAAGIENTHPFKRVLWGRDWIFAHNGTLPEVRARPVG